MPVRSPGAVFTPHATSFTVWAQGRQHVELDMEGLGRLAMHAVEAGYFTLDVPALPAGTRYGFRVEGGPRLPDPASRCQAAGAGEWSVVTANRFAWTDQAWKGLDRRDQVIYQLHIGTFTPAGTWQAAIALLGHLQALGVTAIQLMPVASFKGRFGWGYDTILPYAPFAPYGTPDDMRAFVDAAHAHGIGVLHDVVYNHVGLGDHYRAYSAHYFTTRYENEWGPGFNFDGPHAAAVRDFVIGNAAYWIADFHLDGLRLDATQALHDAGDDHIIAAIGRAARAAGQADGRSVYLLAENQPQDRRLIAPLAEGGYGLDALVSDDFQHAARVAMTGHDDFYYRDYAGTPQELVSALKYGFLYQGQRSDMRDEPHGTFNLDTGPERVVHFLENHDQIANSARGFRLAALASPARIRAMTALLLLGPQTPCLFQGQEFGADNPFLYFLGLEGEEAAGVAKGRRDGLSHFPSVTDPVMQDRLPLPHADTTFAASTLDWDQARSGAPLLGLHRDLLALRRAETVFTASGRRRVDGAVIGPAALLIRFFADAPADERLLLLNLGRDLPFGVIAEPLFAPPAGRKWALAWSSEHPDYDGAGRRPFDADRFTILPADSALLLASQPRSPAAQA